MKKLYRRIKPMFGSFVEIQLPTEDQEYFDRAFDVMRVAEGLLSVHSEKSEISKINRTVNKKITLHPLTIDVLKKSVHMMKETDSLFNITVGGIQQKEELLPIFEGQFDNLPIGSHEDIVLEESSCLLRKPLTLTLDGIAKGYAVDLAYKTLESIGVNSGYINAGGDLRIFGNIELPMFQRGTRGRKNYLGNFKNICIASSRAATAPTADFTSQLYSKRRYDGRTKIWAISAKEAWIADALTKVVSNSKSKQRITLLQKFEAQILN